MKNKYMPKWAKFANKHFTFINKDFPNDFQNKYFKILDINSLMKLCYSYGLLDDLPKAIITSEMQYELANETTNIRELNLLLKNLEIKLKYKDYLDSLAEKQYKDLNIDEQLVIDLGYQCGFISFT